MIKKANDSHKGQITELWSNAFGDKKDQVAKYLNTLLEYFLVYEEDGVVKGMLSVLPVNLKDRMGGYIYAVVTRPEYRGMGICRSLVDYVKEDKNYDFLVLVPQNESLFDFYKNMDFTAVPFLKKDEVTVFGNPEKYSVKIITAKEYEIERNEFYKEYDFINWNEKMLSFAKKMYGGDFCRIVKGEKTVGLAFLYNKKDTVFVKELLSENPREVAEKIGGILGAKKVKFAYESECTEPTFMMYPGGFSGTKFGIFLD